jgi:2,4-dienoyl-CoA reductase-like NADH-dependent reductase (Old Yellow Enzyme family)
MSPERVLEVVGEYRRAAERAIEAGFDGVEIHGAHGYLIDQFTNLAWNRRDDEWGGPMRARFAAEVTREVIAAIGAGRTLFRFSPHMSVSRVPWEAPEETFALLLPALADAGLRILHASNLQYDERILRSAPELDEPDLTLHAATRKGWRGQLIGVGDLSPERAQSAIADDEIDMAAFGRALIANFDLCSRIRDRRELIPYDPAGLSTLL